MTKEQLAALLHGREYGKEIDFDESRVAKKEDLIVLFGYSDDNAEIRGAFHDEIGCYGGGTIYLNSNGPIEDPEFEECKRCRNLIFEYRRTAVKIEFQWDTEGYSWFITTDIPFAPFDIMEDGEKFCRGIVIERSSLPKQ